MRVIKLNSFFFIPTCGLTLDIAPAGLETIVWPLESCWRPNLDWVLNGRLLELLSRVGLALVMWPGEHRVGWSPLRKYWLLGLGASEEVSDPIEE